MRGSREKLVCRASAHWRRVCSRLFLQGEEETGVCECYAEKFVSCEWDERPSCGQIPGNLPAPEQAMRPPTPPIAPYPIAPPPLPPSVNALGMFMEGLTTGFRKGMGLAAPGVFHLPSQGAVPSFLARETKQ